MDFKEKEKLFNQFLLIWEEKFKKIPSILHYLSTYPEIVDKLDDFRLLKIDELNNSQLEWISLIAQQERPIEYNFFKEYWVPIQCDQYSYFIDLSSNSFPIFHIYFFSHEPYRWYKNYVVKNLSQFLIEIDNPEFEIEEFIEDVEEKKWSQISDFFNERDELGFIGKVKIKPITKECIIAKGQEGDYTLNRKGVTFRGVNSLIVGLFPHNLEIKLESFKATFNRNKGIIDKVKDINALVYLLQSVGFLSVDFYSFSFGLKKEYKAIFKDNKLKVLHDDKEFLKMLSNGFDSCIK